MQMTVRAKVEYLTAYPVLEQMAEHLGGVKRSVFVAMALGEDSLNEIKKESQIKFGITSRQFNAIRYDLQGLLSSDREIKKKLIKRTERKKKKLEKKLKKTWNPFLKHQFKRKLQIFEHLLKKYKSEIDSPSICFGGKE